MLKLKELNMKMGKKEYAMYQEIPAKENGSTNLCCGIPYSCFKQFLESQLARSFLNISIYDTPTKIYILYSNSLPIGYIGIRTKVNKQWIEWCGNIFYAIRPSERNKHYGTTMLKLALLECRKLKMKCVYVKSSEGNIPSQKIIENNGGKLLKINNGNFYKIDLSLHKN